MSFGFSPGDIVLFTKFAAKVISSLAEEGASKTQYQLAERQCQAFLSVMAEVQSLDLSNVPASFRAKLDEYSTSVQEFVKEFRDTIARYEKSMGETSERGLFRSAPRKVQWAFMAAEDLALFRQSLSSQLDLVKIIIQSSILSIVTNHQQQRQLQLGPSHTLALNGPVYQDNHRIPMQLEWNRSPILGIDQLLGVDHLADIVYERLLTRPGMPLESHGRIFTLPEDFESRSPSKQLPSPPVKKPSQSAVGAQKQRLLGEKEVENGEVPPGPEGRSDNTLADEINEYLHSLNLDGVSEQDVEHLSQNVHLAPPLLIEGPPPKSTKSPNRAYIEPNEQPLPSKPRESTSRKARFSSSKKSYNPSGFDPLDGLGLAANISSLVDTSAKIAFNIRGAYRSASGAPQELEILSKRVAQYSSLLQSTEAVIRTALPDNLRNMGWDILQDSTEIMNEVQHILEKMKVKPGGRGFAAVRISLRWEFYKERVQKIMVDLESLKSTISVMLQLCQTHTAERQALVMEQQSREAVEHSRATLMTADKLFEILEGELKGRASADVSGPT
ncbi:hypothetical protein DL98DRAFT_486446 [Cadophora sp. DSE1049]|nr:hypothetical protein DL98DRAFT_486446 [Cadophora sp. DSE1049]